LFYRLDVIRIGLPPLRERPQDLPAICASLLERISREAGLDPVPRVGDLVLQQLASHRFPGNVRELENLLHRALALSAGVEITLSDLSLPETEPGDLGGEGAEPLRATRAAPVVSEALATRMSDGPKRFEGPLPADLASYLDAVERQILEEALMRHRFNRTAAGASLGMSLRQIRYRMARLGIHAGADPAEPSTTA
jgi:two-component system response regulator PilR (NtrC family)